MVLFLLLVGHRGGFTASELDDVREDPVRSCVKFEEFRPSCILSVCHLRSNWDMVLDVGNHKSWVESIFGVKHSS